MTEIHPGSGDDNPRAVRRWHPRPELPQFSMRTALLLAFVVLSSGCFWRSGNDWPSGEPAKGPAVVFAPVAMGPLASLHPTGSQTWGADLAARLDLLSRNADGFFGATLQPSDNPTWNAQPAVSTPGAALVVLTTVTTIEDTSTTLNKRLTGTATMRALNADGQQVWTKTISADVDSSDTAKVQGPAGRAEVRAGWAAVSAASNALSDFILTRPDPSTIPPASVVVAIVAPEPPPAAGQVRVTLNSVPPHADVLVDGQLRGTTPCTLDLLSGTEATIRLERAGFQAWERTLRPTAELKLSPALAPITP